MSALATVHVVDDDTSFLPAMSRMLRAAGLPVCDFTSATEFLNQVSSETRGCIVVDLSMPEMDGLELQTALAEAGVAMPVVFLTGHGDIPSSVRAMRAGAVDFLEKTTGRDALLAAIRRALERDAVEHATRARLEEIRRLFAGLTPREREVLLEVVHGRLNKEIAARLGIHERTVKLHRTAITRKVGVHSTAQLATLAREARLDELEASTR
jgi:FixJ family two-component response regulator